MCFRLWLAQNRKYCEDEDDDETLPLGPEFQQHVQLFVVTAEAGTEQYVVSLSSHVETLVKQWKQVRKKKKRMTMKMKKDQE